MKVNLDVWVFLFLTKFEIIFHLFRCLLVETWWHGKRLRAAGHSDRLKRLLGARLTPLACETVLLGFV